jgi:hypothetical protein
LHVAPRFHFTYTPDKVESAAEQLYEREQVRRQKDRAPLLSTEGRNQLRDVVEVEYDMQDVISGLKDHSPLLSDVTGRIAEEYAINAFTDASREQPGGHTYSRITLETEPVDGDAFPVTDIDVLLTAETLSDLYRTIVDVSGNGLHPVIAPPPGPQRCVG